MDARAIHFIAAVFFNSIQFTPKKCAFQLIIKRKKVKVRAYDNTLIHESLDILNDL